MDKKTYDLPNATDAADEKVDRLGAVAEPPYPAARSAQLEAMASTPAPRPGQQLNATQAGVVIDQQIMAPVAVFFNGMLSTYGAQLPMDRLLVAIARNVGAALGRSMNGDLAAVLKIRSECKSEFEKAINAAHLKPAPPPRAPASHRPGPRGSGIVNGNGGPG